jgi:thioredoxin-related protein
MKTILIGILVVFTLTPEWLTNLDNAKETAQKEHKYILLNFSGSDWCAPCIKLKQEVFGNDAFGSLAQDKLVLLRADFPRQKKNQLSKEQTAHNEMLAEKYNPAGKFPYTVLLSADGKVIKSWDGYVFASQDKFIEELKLAIPSN